MEANPVEVNSVRRAGLDGTAVLETTPARRAPLLTEEQPTRPRPTETIVVRVSH